MKQYIQTKQLFFLGVAITLVLALLAVVQLKKLYIAADTATTIPSDSPAWHDGPTFQNKKQQPAEQIIEIDLAYDSTKQPMLSIASARRKNGYVPQYDPPATGYEVRILNDTKSTLFSVKFDVPNEFHAAPPEREGEQGQGPIKLPKVDFTLTAPWHATASEVVILDPAGTQIAARPIKNAQHMNNRPAFRSINGEEFKKAKKPTSWLDGFVPTATAQTTTKTLDIVFIGDNYTASGLTIFHNDVNRFIAHLLIYQPFKARASQIVFHYVDNTADLGCAHDATVTRRIVCNNATATQIINAAGVPYDTIVIISNDSAYGGSGGATAVSYNGASGPQVFVHELGHSFVKLLDEYNAYTSNGVIDNAVHTNCYAGTPPGTAWSTLVGKGDYILGCYYPNWYRPGNNIMFALAHPFFSVIGQSIANAKITLFAGNFTDSSSPTAQILLPANGATMSGTMTVTTSVADNNGIARVELWKDNVIFGTKYIAPFTFTLPTATETNGTHTLQVRAFDAIGNVGTATISVIKGTASPSSASSAAVSSVVTVSSAATSSAASSVGVDTLPPVTRVTTPTSGAVLSKNKPLNISATTNELSTIRLYLDGQVIATCTAVTTCSKTVPSNATAKGTRSVYATGTDAAGNVGTSATVTVTKQ